jgi:hypothetical protein
MPIKNSLKISIVMKLFGMMCYKCSKLKLHLGEIILNFN